MLYIIQVGHNDASDRYIRNKVKAVEEAGLQATVVNLEESCSNEEVIANISSCWLKNDDCKAIMVQLPLPEHLDKKFILSHIPPVFDIDGLNPIGNVKKPLTPCAIMRWLKEQNVNLEGKNVTILGRSELVGKPLANLMIDAGATVTVCNSKTTPFFSRCFCLSSDIIVSAVGKPGIVNWFYISGNFKQIVIDVGINRDENGKLCGDVDSEASACIEKAGGICTPVPGGVGKWTVRELVLRLAEMEGVKVD